MGGGGARTIHESHDSDKHKISVGNDEEGRPRKYTCSIEYFKLGKFPRWATAGTENRPQICADSLNYDTYIYIYIISELLSILKRNY